MNVPKRNRKLLEWFRIFGDKVFGELENIIMFASVLLR